MPDGNRLPQEALDAAHNAARPIMESLVAEAGADPVAGESIILRSRTERELLDAVHRMRDFIARNYTTGAPPRASSLDPDGNILAVVVLTPTYCGAFTIEKNELIETVEQTPDGRWDWDSATVCDLNRGGNPNLQAALRDALHALAEAHRA